MDKPLPSISKPELDRNWNRKRIGFVVPLALLVVIDIVVVLRLSTAQGTSTFGLTVTANDQWKPVVQTFDGVEMVLVPSGCFMMGSTKEQIDALNKQYNGHYDAEGPQTRVCFDKPFWLDRYDVTNAQFARFQ